jgi:3-dehydroquinate synthase
MFLVFLTTFTFSHLFMQYTFTFPGGTVRYMLNAGFGQVPGLTGPAEAVYLVDENVLASHNEKFEGQRVIPVPAGESTKTWQAVEQLAARLIKHQAHRKTMIVGVGGGVTTDITGFLASVYMRGVPFGFVPTTLLAMVDASVGGKNGVNLGHHKNMLGTISQPHFILHDHSFLQTLPVEEWSNGFAEIIKYGFACDARILNLLAASSINHFQRKPQNLAELISGCVDVKNKIVHADEKETGMRKLLNFGHTAGHAFETLYQLSHGHAVALGMQVACIVSEDLLQLPKDVRLQLTTLAKQYGLPTQLRFEVDKVMEVLTMDKKRNADSIDFILLDKIGKGCIKTISFAEVQKALQLFVHEG